MLGIQGGMEQGMLGGEASCHAMIRRRIQRLEVDAGGGYVTVRGGMTLRRTPPD